MRLRISLLASVVIATLLTPISPVAQAFGGYASAPLSVTATAIAGGVRVGWSAPTDVDTGITGYRVEYSTSGTSGNWTLSATVGAAVRSYDIVALSQVETYVRVAATTAAGVGTYGYPWTKLYGTTARNRNSDGTVTYEAGYGLGAGDPYTTQQNASFTRVRYLLNTTLTSGSVNNYADVDFYKWPAAGDTTQRTSSTSDATVRNLSIPALVTTTQIVQANVSDLNVYSDYSTVTDGKGLSGRLEIWAIDYGWGPSGLSPAGSSANFDYDDAPSAGSYGSFQVHDITNSKPVFVWNHQTNGQPSDLNYGLNSTTGANPDSTFCGQVDGHGTCPTFSSFKLQIYANIPVTPLADVTPPTVTRIDARSIGKNGDTITVQSTEIGTVYLVNQSVAVANFASITAAATANKNSISISATGTNTVFTLASLNDGLYNLYAIDSFNNLSTAITGTIKVDNTIPTFTSLAISSSGTALTLTASETITNSMQVYGFYQINDSGTAISVTGTSYSGNIATLTLSRAIPAGASIVLSYAPSSGAAGGRWIDQAGNEVAAFTNRVVTNNSTTPISITFNVPATIYKGSSVTISLVVPVTGKVTFSLAGKRLPGCFNRAATGSLPITISCNWKPALSTAQSLTATFVPTNTSIAVATTTVNRFILKRTTTR